MLHAITQPQWVWTILAIKKIIFGNRINYICFFLNYYLEKFIVPGETDLRPCSTTSTHGNWIIYYLYSCWLNQLSISSLLYRAKTFFYQTLRVCWTKACTSSFFLSHKSLKINKKNVKFSKHVFHTKKKLSHVLATYSQRQKRSSAWKTGGSGPTTASHPLIT